MLLMNVFCGKKKDEVLEFKNWIYIEDFYDWISDFYYNFVLDFSLLIFVRFDCEMCFSICGGEMLFFEKCIGWI